MTNHPRRSRRARTYFILAERAGPLSAWRVEFGSYEFDEVDAERQDRRDRGVRASDLRVKRCTDLPGDADGVLTRLNAVRRGG